MVANRCDALLFLAETSLCFATLFPEECTVGNERMNLLRSEASFVQTRCHRAIPAQISSSRLHFSVQNKKKEYWRRLRNVDYG